MEYLSIHEIKPKNEGKKRYFDNPLLERLTYSHISMPISVQLLSGAAFIYWGTRVTNLVFTDYLGLFFIGLLSFTLFEYLMHRYLYHMVPDNKVKGWLQYNLHGVHHEYPKDKGRLSWPPVITIVLCLLFLMVFRLIMGDYAFGFTPGFLAGYASYLGVHYIVHAIQPPKNFLKVLWINHGIHHYKDPDRAFGVSSPLWDYIFRTLPRKKTK
jgi:sterol desaturase/sphingolipid hydroxylase (fatty acid hydroxylase superfamily)